MPDTRTGLDKCLPIFSIAGKALDGAFVRQLMDIERQQCHQYVLNRSE